LQQWDEKERRNDRGERRAFSDRRLPRERRFDFREANPPPVRRPIKAWVRSLCNARLGVDRRKKEDRRVHDERRSRQLRSLLTPEELADLLSD
jgi:hypothetical protein